MNLDYYAEWTLHLDFNYIYFSDTLKLVILHFIVFNIV